MLYNLFVACALIFNQYANPIALDKIGWKCKNPLDLENNSLADSIDYIFYDVWLAFEALVVYFSFVETGNVSLEQTAAILDGVVIQDKLADDVARNTETIEIGEKGAREMY